MMAVAPLVVATVPADVLAEDNVVAALLFAAVGGPARAAGVVRQAREVGLSGEWYLGGQGLLWETAAGIVDRGGAPEVPVMWTSWNAPAGSRTQAESETVLGLAVTPSYVGGAAAWAARLVGKHRQRLMLQLGNRLAQTAWDGVDTRQVAEGLREALELVEGARQPGVEVALALEECLGLELEQAEPLLGSDGENLIPRGSLVVLAGKPRVGKTTFALDLVFQLGRSQVPAAPPLCREPGAGSHKREGAALVTGGGPRLSCRQAEAGLPLGLAGGSGPAEAYLVNRVWVHRFAWRLEPHGSSLPAHLAPQRNGRCPDPRPSCV